MYKLLSVLLCSVIVVWGITSVVLNIQFDRNCVGYLKRAADSNTIQLAEKNLAVAVEYLEEEGYTSGYTSVLWQTPDEDVGFWYSNLRSSFDELGQADPEATQLEKSNLLMKLRETLLDEGSDGTEVTFPQGMAKFPNNVIFAIWAIIGFILAIGGVLVWDVNSSRTYRFR